AAPAVGNVDTPIYLDSNSGNLTKPGYTFGGWNTLANGTGTTYAAGYRYTATANVTLYAKWTALPTFTISFNGNGITGGAAPASLTGVYSTATLPGVGTMVKAGFVFAGWNTAADGLGSAYAAGETLTPQATTTLYAQWTANPTYTLTYDSNGATSGSVPAVATASSTYVVIDNNTGSLFKTGYIFSGWNSAADGTGTSYTGGNNFLLNANTTFYAKWVAANYTVTYSGNGNTGGTAPAAATGVSISTVTPTNSGSLVKAGYTFVGWNTLASGLGTDYAVGATYSPTSSTTLYAKWTALPTYTITYDGNGNTGGGVPVAQSGIYAAVNLDTNSGALVKSGAYFSGWNTQADGLGTHYAAGASFTPSANITLYAEWSANPTFTLTYDGNSKTGGVAPVPQTGISSTATVLGNTGSLVRLGYRFDGWNTLANGTGTTYIAGSTITLTADTTLYAIWTSVPTYTLSYSGNGQSTGSVPLAVTTSSGSVTLSANINVLTKNNYNFTGWNTQANGLGTHYNAGDSFALSANTTIYAEWTPMSYTLTYNANGANSGTAPAATTAAGAQTTAANTGSLALTNYGFTGWNTAADGSGTSYAVGASITLTANTTLFAKWTTYVITYNGNGNDSGTGPGAVNRYGSYTIETAGNLGKTGYTFTGWNTAANGSGTAYAAGSTQNATAAITLYAIWSLIPVYTITYNANSATSGSVPTAQSGIAGNYNLAMNSGTLARTGYIFEAWNTAANGSGTTYVEGAVYALSANVTLYAKWIQLFNVTFDGNGATAGSSPIFASSQAATITLPGNDGSYAKIGYVFGGWNTAANGTGTNYAAGSSYVLSSSATLYANWVQLVSITYDANGATSGSAPSFTPVVPGTVTLASNTGSMTLAGYYFGGWNTAANGTGTNYAAGSSYILNSNATLYAIWTPSVRTITFDANGAQSGSVPSAITVAPGSVTLPANTGTLARDGYYLAGWNTAANGTGTTFAVGGSYTLTNNVTLYAVWELKPVYPIGASWISRNILPLSGGQVTLTGFGFDRLVSVTMSGVAVQVVSSAYDRVVLNLPAMPAGTYVLSFVATTTKLDFAQSLVYQADKTVAIANYLNTTSVSLVKLQTIDALVSAAGKFSAITLAVTTTPGNAKAIRQNAAKLLQVLKLAQRLTSVYQVPVSLSLKVNAGSAITGIRLSFSAGNSK
ncbi:MAG: InlB B-repeat-containing protein, partial [Actinomycetales bacterium]|nr:InlB B-repeat-containing protein [Actinomycetales bacterium]